jgi:serine/threonine-protein kinase SRK2
MMVMFCLGEEVAIKLISLGGRFYRKYVEREILNHRQLMHPHIVAFKEVFVTSKVCTIHYLYIHTL